MKIFSFCPILSFLLSVSLYVFRFSVSLLASLDLFHLIGLVLCQATRREERKKRKKKQEKKKKEINNSPKSTFFLLSTTWWTQVIRKRRKRLKSFHNYACVSNNQGQSSKRTHIDSYTSRMIMLMMMIQFSIFNIDI